MSFSIIFDPLFLNNYDEQPIQELKENGLKPVFTSNNYEIVRKI